MKIQAARRGKKENFSMGDSQKKIILIPKAKISDASEGRDKLQAQVHQIDDISKWISDNWH